MTQAVQAVWATIPTQTPALPSTLWFEEVGPTQAQMPVARYVHKGEPPIPAAYPTGATKPVMLNGSFDIELYYWDVAQLEKWAKAVMTAFNVYIQTALDMDSSQHGRLVRDDYKISPTGLLDTNQKPIRKLTISYKAWIGNPAA